MLRASALGLQVVITFAVLAWAGHWLDGRYGYAPWGTLSGVALGLFAMVTALLRESGTLKSQAERERERAERAEREGDGDGDDDGPGKS
jgi:F0F1-type ATP synthase assembly protein I